MKKPWDFERGIETEYECEYTADFTTVQDVAFMKQEITQAASVFDVIAQKYSDYNISIMLTTTQGVHTNSRRIPKAKEILSM